ncbi:sulfatase family protein [Gaoshiqia sediminis]|uniref:Sulfatase n=1 Tax=Gaoshiqia sediminis TaxID=2986998 RepID=A0AA42C9V2_9BACT|nr:sulfatase [Gaoshiqia sediminis]MCW0484516.1 sulfatase [Gaoshiqia sediminis]
MKQKSILAALATCSALALNAQNQEKPNLVLFLADDCTYFDIGCYGSADSQTPNIDKFASEGIRFTNGFQAAPMCSPTRHNLLTGLWPVKTGAYPNHTNAIEGTLSIVQQLKPAGYQVALVGKSHVNPESVFPWDLYAPLTKSNDLNFAAIDSFIEDCTSNDQPFCLVVTTNQPHTPWNKGNPDLFNPEKLTLPPYYVDTKETRQMLCKYLAEINYMDNEFGTLLKKLDQYKIADKSVVVYLSEQGNSLPFAKWTCYDAGVHSAYMVRWPGVIKPGTESDAIVEYVDIVPTFLDIAGVAPSGPLDGKSIVPVLEGKQKENKQYTFSLQTTRGIYSGSEYYGIRSVADKKYRYIVNLTPEATFKNTESAGRLFKIWQEKAKTDPKAKWLTERYQHRPPVELYDVENDQYCMNNIADKPESQEIIKRLDQALREWMEYCGDQGQETEMEAPEHQHRNAQGRIGE